MSIRKMFIKKGVSKKRILVRALGEPGDNVPADRVDMYANKEVLEKKSEE